MTFSLPPLPAPAGITRPLVLLGPRESQTCPSLLTCLGKSWTGLHLGSLGTDYPDKGRSVSSWAHPLLAPA